MYKRTENDDLASAKKEIIADIVEYCGYCGPQYLPPCIMGSYKQNQPMWYQKKINFQILWQVFSELTNF